MYKIGDWVHVHDLMQQDYSYQIVAASGQDFDPNFSPFYAPQDMLCMGIFEGKYCNDCREEFPHHWFTDAKLSDAPDPGLNCFGVKSRQPLSYWQQKGWIFGPDPRGWFQWFCRYYLGRRIPDVDHIQIKRWRQFARHAGQIRKNCRPGDTLCRPRQRQALLQWSHNPFI